jgi:hypothetical protein
MAVVRDVAEVEAALAALAARSPHPLVRQLQRAPGQRDARWLQLFTGDDAAAPPAMEALPAQPSLPLDGDAPHAAAAVQAAMTDDRGERLARLENEVRQLRAELEALRQTITGERSD